MLTISGAATASSFVDYGGFGKYKQGLAFLLTTRGTPSMYYGTEILMKNFKDPSDAIKKKDADMRGATAQVEEGNALIEKLRRQTEENKEKNDLIVKQKTLLNDSVRTCTLL